MLITFQMVLGVILLLNISIDVVYPTISTPAYYSTPQRVKGGVITMDQSKISWLHQFPDSWLQGLALSTFGVTMGHTLTPTSDLTFLGVFSPPDCPVEAEYCLQLYLTQAPPYPQNVSGISLSQATSDQSHSTQRPPLIRLFETPIYHIYLNKNAGSCNFPLEKCRSYGYSTDGLIMCAMEYQTQGDRTSLAVGEDLPLRIFTDNAR